MISCLRGGGDGDGLDWRAVGGVGATHWHDAAPADGRGRPWRSSRAVLDGILWILRTGAQWADLPDRYPPHQTGHRRYQRWVREGLFERILEALAQDLKERGGLDLSECFIDGTFIVAKKGEDVWARPSG